MLEMVGSGNDWLESMANLPKNPRLLLSVPIGRGVVPTPQLDRDWDPGKRSPQPWQLSPWRSCPGPGRVPLFPSCGGIVGGLSLIHI